VSSFAVQSVFVILASLCWAGLLIYVIRIIVNYLHNED
jgi:hypothetical protein